MPLFSAKLDYALRAAIDLAQQRPGEACQSREIASRQDIRGPYLDQILAILKREGLVRSIRGAGGGYTLTLPPHKITVGAIVRAIIGTGLLISSVPKPPQPNEGGSTYVVRQFQERVEAQLNSLLDGVTLADLVAQQQHLDDTLSIMPGI